MNTVIEAIAHAASAGACFVGVGNEIRGDDAAGLALFDGLKYSLDPHRFGFIRAEDIIESYIGDIVSDPRDTVIVIDAVNGCDEGSLVFGELDGAAHESGLLSTHKLALKLACSMLKARGKRTWLLGIGVTDIDYRVGLSGGIAALVPEVRDRILEKLH